MPEPDYNSKRLTISYDFWQYDTPSCTKTPLLFAKTVHVCFFVKCFTSWIFWHNYFDFRICSIMQTLTLCRYWMIGKTFALTPIKGDRPMNNWCQSTDTAADGQWCPPNIRLLAIILIVNGILWFSRFIWTCHNVTRGKWVTNLLFSSSIHRINSVGYK